MTAAHRTGDRRFPCDRPVAFGREPSVDVTDTPSQIGLARVGRFHRHAQVQPANLHRRVGPTQMRRGYRANPFIVAEDGGLLGFTPVSVKPSDRLRAE
jgi:hypothetical protein